MCVASHLHAGRLFICTAYGVQCPILPSMPSNSWISPWFLGNSGFPLRIDSGETREPTWDIMSYKQHHPFGLLSSRILELHEGERHVKRITSLFKTLNILWVCWAASHVKWYYSISTCGRALNKSKNSAVVLGGHSRCLPDAESTPVASQSSVLWAWSHKALI